MHQPSLLRAFARALVAGDFALDQVFGRAVKLLGTGAEWLLPLAQRYVNAFSGRTRPRRRQVIQFLRDDPGFLEEWRKRPQGLLIDDWIMEPQRMQPVAAAQAWAVPAVESIGDLAKWLQLSLGELEWFADLRGLGCKQAVAPLRHYHYRILAKQSGGVRLIEAPKPRLKQLQRTLLAGILDKIPPHSAAHGFVKGRSIRTFASPHVGQRVVLRMDLRDFFRSIAAARIQTFYRTLGYPEGVADLLGGLCTTCTPRDVWNEAEAGVEAVAVRAARALYTTPHLPQGAPTSPALANLCAYRVDCRLAALARAAGAAYTRYADDLAFSGGPDFERSVERFSTHAAVILEEEGFSVHHRKTRVMRRGVRQYLAGVVANESTNVVRTDFDVLKATLTNCVRLGPGSQNRAGHASFRAHLEGRIGFVEMLNPAKGRRLRAIFVRIVW